MRAPSRLVAVATTLVFFSACVERHTIPTAQLEYLNGYDIHGEQSVNGVTFTDRPYRLIATDGAVVDYNSSKSLVLVGAGGGPLTPPGPFQSITISEGAFDAVPLFGPPFGVPLNTVSAAVVTQSSPERTAELIGAVSLVLSLIGLGLTIAAVSSGGSQPVPCCALRAQGPAGK
jgi:hypothetical protein